MLSLLNDFEAIGSAKKFTVLFASIFGFTCSVRASCEILTASVTASLAFLDFCVDILRSLYITVNHPATKDYQTNVLSCQVNDDIV